jgi:glycerophosphoryl diester phosphodiesterase
MKSTRRRNYIVLALCVGFGSTLSQASEPVPNPTKVIAHRGASGYAIEHTEAAKCMAHAQDADYIEQDVVLTKDLVFIVSHDITMDATTDVAMVYPDRRRADGKFYFLDFTAQELKNVSMKPRSMHVGDKDWHGPGVACGQRILQLDQEVRMLRALDQATSRRTGLYIELKSPSFHRKETGQPMGKLLLAKLQELDVSTGPVDCLLQCFEAEELIELKTSGTCPYALVQLLSLRNADIDLSNVAKYAVGVGPALGMLAKSSADGPFSTGFAERAKAAGLLVHPYTVRQGDQPTWSRSLDETHRFLIKDLRIDAFFTDYPDLGRAAVRNIR